MNHVSPKVSRRAVRRRWLLSTTAAVAAFGLAAVPTAAHASGRSVDVVNATNDYVYPVQLLGGDDLEDHTPNQTAIAPGASAHYEIKIWGTSSHEVRFEDKTGSNVWNVQFLSASKGFCDLNNAQPAVPAYCSGPGDMVYLHKGIVEGSTIRPDPSVLDLGSADPDLVSATLQARCAQENDGCEYHLSSRTAGFSPYKIAGASWSNRTSSPVSKKFTTTTKRTSSQSWEIGGSLKTSLFGKIEATVNTKYSHSWGEEETSTDETTFSVKPDTRVWPETRFSVFLYSGYFDVSIDGTAYRIPGTVEVPDPDGYVDTTWREEALSD